GALGILRDGRYRDYLLAGAAAGLATATKYNGILVLAALVAAHALREVAGGRLLRSIAVAPRLLVALGVAAAVFVALDPYLFLDSGAASRGGGWNGCRFFRGGQMLPEPVDVGPGWWYHFAVSLRYGMGVALLGLALAGMARVAWCRDRAGLVLLAFVLVFYLVMGGARLVFLRYMTPLLPILCVFAAAALPDLSARLRVGGARFWVGAALAGLAVAEPLDSAASYGRMVHHADTRVEAMRFVESSLQSGGEVATYGPSEVWRSILPRSGPFLYARHPRQSWDDVLDVLTARGYRYLIVHQSPLETLSPAVPDLDAALGRRSPV